VSQKLIVIDSSHPLVRENHCFDPAVEYTGCGHPLNVRLAREARKRGMEIVTADVYLAMGDPSLYAACVTDMVTPFTDALIAKGVRPSICMSLESPLNAQRFYHHIARYAGRFRHNYQFRGTRERLVATGTVFHPIVFPVETRMPLPLRPWGKRDHLVLVNSNKRAVGRTFHNLKEFARAVAMQTRFKVWRLTDPWLRIREIYVDRIEAIRYFADHPGFRLYGLGWDQPIPGFGPDYRRAVRKAYVGVIPPDVRLKRQVMSDFRYAICFENCSFPGYVTEKIVDCFLAGCIPVYWGAPDITDFVPRETFIDFRRFGSFEELDRYTTDLTEIEAMQYLEAARDFLSSKSFDKFYVDMLVHEWLDIIDQQALNKLREA
jgi:hypothetical protein